MAPMVCYTHILSLLSLYLFPKFPRPMSHISAVFGSDDDQEILDSLYTIVNVRPYLLKVFDLDFAYRIHLDLV